MFNSISILGYVTPLGSQTNVVEWTLLDEIVPSEHATPARIRRDGSVLWAETELSVLNPDSHIPKGAVVAIDQVAKKIVGYRNGPFGIQVHATIGAKYDLSGAWIIIDREDNRLVLTRTDDGIVVLTPHPHTGTFPHWWKRGTAIMFNGKHAITEWFDLVGDSK